MYDLSIYLFGSPQITRGNQPIALQRRKDLALLVYLVVTDQPQTRDTLAALLWPDSGQDTARANVRKNISRLKGDLGSEILLTQHDQVLINPNLSLWLDVRQFQLHVEQPKKHNHILHENNKPLCEVCQPALEEAVRLYRGEFLEGFNLLDSRTFDEWQFFQSEGYRQSLGVALQHLIQQSLHLEEYDPAIEYCRKWLALDVFNEPAHRQLMLAYTLGGQQAAALRQFAECSRLLKEELGTDPEPDTVELHEAIRTKKINRPGEAHEAKKSLEKREPEEISSPAQSLRITHNIPITTTPFVGRTKELGRIKELLDEPACRVVTLIGPGGSGKTRLAIQTGSALYDLGGFKDGVWYIQLAPLTDHNSIVPSIQNTLNIPSSYGQEPSRQQLFNYLRNRNSLLILDNFEHLLNTESLMLISELIQYSPQIKILITSRERLNIQGEYLFPVDGLATPSNEAIPSGLETDPDQNAFGAIQLFEQSAKRVRPAFTINRDNIQTITRICQYVQGMPLAIELAAAWIEALSLEEIFNEIKQDLDFLKSELHDIPDRQRSLRAVFDTSWEKLSPPTRSTIKALSVFRSNFSRQAAQAITGLSAKTLLELTNKSWIQPQRDGKYQIHELLRQFACEELENEPFTFAQVREKYCAYYSDRLAVLWEMTKGPEQSKFYDEMEFEFENIKVAWGWLVEQGDYEAMVNNMLPALFVYSEIRGKSIELMDLCAKALKRLENSTQTVGKDKLEIILRTAQGSFWADGHPMRYEFFDGIYPVNLGGIQRAWELSQSSVEFHELGYWGVLLAFIYGHLSNADAGIRQLEATIPYIQTDNNLWELANARLHLARLLLKLEAGNGHAINESVRRHLSEALVIFKSFGDAANCGQVLRHMGNLSMKEQNLSEAIRQWRNARSNLLRSDVNEWAAASSINWQIGDAYLQLGEFDIAYKCFQEISQINLRHGFILQAVGALSKESFEKSRYGDLNEAINIRRQCLELIQQTGQQYQIAWNYWEMGELMRLAGKSGEAVEWFDRSHKIFEPLQDDVGVSFYWRGMGDIFLAKNELEEASRAFLKSAKLAREIQHNWMTAYSQNGLGKTRLYLNDLKSAGEHFLMALNLARKAHDPGITLTILAGLSEWHARNENAEKAALLNTLVLSHFASWNEIKTLAAKLTSSLKNKFLPREFNDLKKKGQLLELWQTVDQEISELQMDT